MNPTVAEVFSYRQYTDKTLDRLHTDLQKRDWTRPQDPATVYQMHRCREEMERRGMRLTNYKKGHK
jgi:hypothetical protein